ncbi:sugar phosphate nucleotidyltransferase [Paenibacillus lupini]|uniref:sugar phosphate nucleotidyltransferase n=1 Tax=Paenibacillus lupini TaxID=1450204 RepID=UPI00141D79E8|nr:sugar phosphate nucleotidyltransferase [Paenibacillus lupini]NIK24111.1 mannose-1-phosphate guanylyltransferase [Paenibacillus lupini]
MGEQQVRLVLLAGGQGKRMWPLSHAKRAKQLLPLITGEEGARQSLLQRLWSQLGKIGLQQDTFIAISRHQVETVRNQMEGSSNVIREPEAKGMYPAVALAAVYLYSVASIPLYETVAVLPSDLYLEDEEWLEALKELPEQFRKHELSLVQTSDGSGIVAFQLGTVISCLQQEGLPLQYEQLYRHYEELHSSLAQVVEQLVEGCPTFKMPELPFYHINSWDALHTALPDNDPIYNDSAVPIVLKGLNDITIAMSSAGILVAAKGAVQSEMELQGFRSEEPLFLSGYEEGSWGYATVIHTTTTTLEGHQSVTRQLTVMAGKELAYELYLKRKKIWTVLAGEGEAVLNEERRAIRAGDVIEIAPRVKHTIRAVSHLSIIEVQIGSELMEDDRIILADNWEDLLLDYAAI